MGQFTFSARLNPLRCFQIEDDLNGSAMAPTYADLFEYLVHDGADRSIDAIKARYEEIVEPGRVLFVAPVGIPHVLEKLFWPLKHAVSSYMLSNFIGVISQCGYVAEMVAILWLDMGNFTINANPMTEELQKKLFGRTFEKMGQEQRVRVLDGYGLIAEAEKQHFNLVREIRRKYLHLISHSHDNIQDDSRAIFGSSAQLVKSVLGLGLDEGRVTFSPLFNQWMTRHMPEIAAQQGDSEGTP